MTLIGLLVILLVAGAVVWVAMHLPQPFNWIVIVVVAVVLLLVLLSVAHVGGGHLGAVLAAASWS